LPLVLDYPGNILPSQCQIEKRQLGGKLWDKRELVLLWFEGNKFCHFLK
jgi:hypothetical protein